MRSKIIQPRNVIVFLAIILFTISGCRAFKGAANHGWEGSEYENTYLSINSPLGSKAFQNWCDFDIDVREYFRKYQKPDVVYSKSLEVTFYYLKEKVQVKFTRPAVGFKTKKETSYIPIDLLEQLNKRFK